MRKKIYLVKRDENIPCAQDNWVIMDGKQFLSFIRSNEGKRRSKGFATLRACEKNDRMIVIECGEEKAKEIRKENDHSDYLRKQEESFGYEQCSFEAVNKGGCLEDVIEDPYSDVETFVVDRQMCRQLRQCVLRLTKDEQRLVRALYLSNDPDTEKEYGEKLGLSQQTVHNMKIRILEKLKKMMI